MNRENGIGPSLRISARIASASSLSSPTASGSRASSRRSPMLAASVRSATAPSPPPTEHEPDAGPHERMAAEQDGNGRLGGRSGQRPEPRFLDPVREQQVARE